MNKEKWGRGRGERRRKEGELERWTDLEERWRERRLSLR